MKRFLILSLGLLLLVGCKKESPAVQGGVIDLGGGPTVMQTSPVTPLEAKKPKLPKKKPETDLGTPDESGQIVQIVSESDARPAITREDIERGWYFAKQEDKRAGTPNTWIFKETPQGPLWISPNALESFDQLGLKDLCEKTGGVYHISCMDQESEGCEYIEKTQCVCSSEKSWDESAGCK